MAPSRRKPLALRLFLYGFIIVWFIAAAFPFALDALGQLQSRT